MSDESRQFQEMVRVAYHALAVERVSCPRSVFTEAAAMLSSYCCPECGRALVIRGRDVVGRPMYVHKEVRDG